MASPFSGFWKEIQRPIIGLAPMDGITDSPFRRLCIRHGRPDVVFTEFTTAQGMFRAPERVLMDFEYSECERPVVAQVFGSRPDDFYRAAHVVCELGFDGVDVNMGCPARQVTQKHGGAMLITTPSLAREILAAVRAGLSDWAAGQTLEELRLPGPLAQTIGKMNEARTGERATSSRHLIPFSVKTRIGYDRDETNDWIATLLEERPATISIHGRTLKQMYKGQASWEAIGRAAQIASGSGTLILGNGDVTSLVDAAPLITASKVDGILIGRASIGNPWIFGEKVPSLRDRFMMILEHARLLSEGGRDFKRIRKHLVGYLRAIPNAASLRHSALQATTAQELQRILYCLAPQA